MLESPWLIAALWVGMALLASLISIRFAISVALIEIIVGAVAGNAIPWVTGGEPFEQPEAVGILCRKVRRRGLSVMVFTGWTYERICRSQDWAVSTLLGQIDILVDGPFIQRLADPGLIWRGSRNQRILFLTDRYCPQTVARGQAPQVEARFSASAAVGITGFPEPQDLSALAGRLEGAGITLEPAKAASRCPATSITKYARSPSGSQSRGDGGNNQG